jgi:hypothetical protein
MAYADDLAGPWKIYSPGTLQHSESFFPAELATDAVTRPSGYVVSLPHIASPDVTVDEGTQTFRMYYHGILRDRHQVTRVATSEDGIHFTAHEPILGSPYWRAFEYDGWHYGLAMPGVFYRSRNPLGPFEEGPTLFTSVMRHAAVLVEGSTLTVFFTNVGEAPPERILVTTVDLSGDWMSWTIGAQSVVLEPERDYEGADLPLVPSIRGEVTERARSSAIQRSSKTEMCSICCIHLLYSVAGESGIGIARLQRG